MKQPILSAGGKIEKKPNLYLNDGVGRDTYISYNNGGNFGAEYRFLVQPQSRTGMNMMASPPSRAHDMPQRLFYQSDGSGRDTYIIKNVDEKFQSTASYKKMLRSPTQQYFSPKYRYELPPLAKEKFRRTLQSQRESILRLSRGKQQ